MIGPTVTIPADALAALVAALQSQTAGAAGADRPAPGGPEPTPPGTDWHWSDDGRPLSAPWPAIADESVFQVGVIGEKMLPEFRPGDHVIFSTSRQPSDGAPCLVRFAAGDVGFYRVWLIRSWPGGPVTSVRLGYLNPAYCGREVPASEVLGIFPALAINRDVTTTHLPAGAHESDAERVAVG